MTGLETGETVAQMLVRLRVPSANISLDTLDREIQTLPAKQLVHEGGARDDHELCVGSFTVVSAHHMVADSILITSPCVEV